MLLFIACMCGGVLTVIITQGSTYLEYIIDCVSHSVFIFYDIFFIIVFFKSTTIFQFQLQAFYISSFSLIFLFLT